MGERTGLKQVLPPVRAFLRAVALHYPVEVAYVFGSYARGMADPDSDIDVAIISSAFSGDRFEDNAALARLTWGIDTRIEPIALRPESLASDSSLAATIRAEGLAVPLGSDMEKTLYGS